MRFQCCRQQAMGQMCHGARLSSHFSALAENPSVRPGESRNSAETLKRLITKDVSPPMHGRTLLSSAVFCAGGSALMFGVLFQEDLLEALPSVFFLPPDPFWLNLSFSSGGILRIRHFCCWKIDKYFC